MDGNLLKIKQILDESQGSYSILIQVEDAYGLQYYQSFSIELHSDEAPEINLSGNEI